MSETNNKQEWKKYCEYELARILPILEQQGFRLDPEQPHLGGERYLMQAITTTSGKKLILLGSRKSDNRRVVIKATSDIAGSREIEHERVLRDTLQKINFAYQVFLSPEELLFKKQNGITISVQAFIEHARPFMERPTEEQFSLALKAFKAQEGARATTYEHRRFIKKTFGSKTAKDYIKTFEAFSAGVIKDLPEQKELHDLLKEAQSILQTHTETIEQYSGFLTHTDFVPHNIRVVGGDIYLLDHSSIRFGNKHEGLARFINFMALYNQALEQALVEYIRNNKAEEELLSLQLMRVYRLGELIYYYARTLQKSSGDLLTLNRARVNFWEQVLKATLQNRATPKEIIEKYIQNRDSLRSNEEKQRQKGLH